MVDPAAAKKGADTWRTKERVILVLGGKSTHADIPQHLTYRSRAFCRFLIAHLVR